MFYRRKKDSETHAPCLSQRLILRKMMQKKDYSFIFAKARFGGNGSAYNGNINMKQEGQVTGRIKELEMGLEALQMDKTQIKSSTWLLMNKHSKELLLLTKD